MKNLAFAKRGFCVLFLNVGVYITSISKYHYICTLKRYVEFVLIIISFLIEGEIVLTKDAEISTKKNFATGGKRGRFSQAFSQTLTQFKKTKYLQMLAIPGIIYYIIFRYIPMYGVTIAFKDYDMRLGIMGSP